MNGECLCGAVTIALPGPPDYINICNCRLCRASGAAWGYFDDSTVRIDGDTTAFVRNDLSDPWLRLHSCPTCGATTHYDATPAHPSARIGVNMRLFALEAIDGIRVVYQDGTAVESENDDFVTTATGCIGDGKAF